MMEVAFASYTTMIFATHLLHHKLQGGMHASLASISAPLALPTPSSSIKTTIVLQIDLSSGHSTFISNSDANTAAKKHFDCGASQIFGHQEATKKPMSRSVLPKYLCVKSTKPSNTALASIWQPKMSQSEQYVMHPTLLDNSTQASAALANTQLAKSPFPTRVPVRMSACLLSKQPCQPWTNASIVDLTPDGSVICDYGIGSADRLGWNANIHGLKFKPLGHTIQGAPVPKQFTRAENHLYKVNWPALEAYNFVNERHHVSRPTSLVWQTKDSNATGGNCLHIKGSSSPLAVAKSLRFVQMLKNTQEICLMSAASNPTIIGEATILPHSRSVRDAIAIGILRVASQETPTVSWQQILHSPYNPTNILPKRSSQIDNVSGISAVAGAWHLPRLAPMDKFEPFAMKEKELAPSFPGPYATIIIGGLGGIGSLLGHRIINGHGQAPTTMLSRSGRHNGLTPMHTAMSMGLVSFARCDAASLEEVAALATFQASTHQVLQHIIHSGGAIADRRIVEQVRNRSWHSGRCLISFCITLALPFVVFQLFYKNYFWTCDAVAYRLKSNCIDYVLRAIIQNLTSNIDNLKDLHSMRITMASKLVAGNTMANAFSPQPIQQWTMFSSLSALVGTPGQANYAAANLQINEFSKSQEQMGEKLWFYYLPKSHSKTLVHNAMVTFMLWLSIHHLCFCRIQQCQHHVGSLGSRHGKQYYGGSFRTDWVAAVSTQERNGVARDSIGLQNS